MRAMLSETRRAHESLTKALEAERSRAEEAAKELKQAQADAAAAKKVRRDAVCLRGSADSTCQVHISGLGT